MKKLLLFFSFVLIIIVIVIINYLTKNINEKTPASQFSAWIPYWDQKKALDSLNKSNNTLKIISPLWYFIDEKIQLTIADKIDKEEFKTKANEFSIKILPSISNQFDQKNVSKLINNPALSNEFINSLIKKAYEEGYQGWDIDFEELKIKDKQAYNKFIENLSYELHKNNLLIAVSVHAQREGKKEREAAQVQDWVRLSKAIDYVRIMAYDFHNLNSSPGQITPISDYKLVLQKALNTIPIEKIVIGLPLYGYDWSEDKNVSLEYDKAIEISQQLNINFIRDRNSRALNLKYKDNNIDHIIWVEDSESVTKKIEIARSMGIYQFCFWRLGGEDPNLWQKLLKN